MLSDDIKFFSEWSYEFKSKENELTVWFKQNKYAFNDGEDTKLLQEIFNYITSSSFKKTKKYMNELFKKTYNERVKEALSHVGKLGLLLHNGMSTKKGRELSEMLIDLVNNPNDYFYKVEQINGKVNLEDIKDALKAYGVSIESRRKLLKIIQ